MILSYIDSDGGQQRSAGFEPCEVLVRMEHLNILINIHYSICIMLYHSHMIYIYIYIYIYIDIYIYIERERERCKHVM